MDSPPRRAAPKIWREPSDARAKRAETPLYQDPFAGICAAARQLPPRERARQLASCPRCGGLAGEEPVDPDAGCLLEGLMLDLRSSAPAGT